MKKLCWVPYLSILLAGMIGCDEPRAKTAKEKAADAKAKLENKDVVKPREILGKTTTDIRDMNAEKAKGAVVADNAGAVRKEIFAPSKYYVVSIDRIAAMNVKHAVDLYQAETGAYPKDYNEFMQNVIKKGQPDEIRLPTLPYYQEYSYDAEKHELIVLEYPARKQAVENQKR
ncbi:MAG: hypothetical protein RJA81_866 [Planctomycetota bacterium]|jgi:hypothetical protein